MNANRPLKAPELFVVMPVYNEAASVRTVLAEWVEALEREKIDYRLLAINDGSRDETLLFLEQAAREDPERLLVLDKANSGHGQSCRAGYEQALAASASWILQIDSDGQCDPGYFADFWRKRDAADCVFGERVVRDDGLIRKAISTGCRALTALVTGRDLKDVNVPYRLMRRDALARALPQIPPDFDLQNIALTLALKRQRQLRWVHLPIRFRERRGGTNSINIADIVRKGCGMLMQIHRVRSAN